MVGDGPARQGCHGAALYAPLCVHATGTFGPFRWATRTGVMRRPCYAQPVTDTARPPADHDLLARAVAAREALDEATRAMAGVLAVDRVLQLIVDRVRELIGARYAALGIVDAEGQIEQFITSGMSSAERARIGAPPRGHGLLGLIIRENRTIRIPDIATDPRSYGFPRHHPEMHAFLGVPVAVRGRTIGNLYLTEKEGGFSDDDQRARRDVRPPRRRSPWRTPGSTSRSSASPSSRSASGSARTSTTASSRRSTRSGLSLEDVPDLMDEEPDEARPARRAGDRGLDQTIRDIRNFIFGLRPAAARRASTWSRASPRWPTSSGSTRWSTSSCGPAATADGARLGPDRTLELLSIAREALSNIARHARATRAEIGVAPEPEIAGVEIEIADNGVGLRPGRAARPRPPGPAQHAHARRSRSGATLVVDSRAGRRDAYHRPGARADRTDESSTARRSLTATTPASRARPGAEPARR